MKGITVWEPVGQVEEVVLVSYMRFPYEWQRTRSQDNTSEKKKKMGVNCKKMWAIYTTTGIG